MAYITFKGEKPRRLRFGFNAMGFLTSAHGISDITVLVADLEKGYISNFSILMEAFLVGDNEGLSTEKLNDLLDDFIADEGLEKLGKLIEETMQESAIFKDAARKKAKAGKKNKKNKKK